MDAQIILLRETASVAELADRAVSAVVNGEVDPITAHINMSRVEAAITQFKSNPQVRDITLRELSKYGKSHIFGDCRLEEAESGVKYDYSMCGDSKLAEMYKTLEAVKADIRERETMLKSLPKSGMADPETGEMVYPPARSSKTIIKTTFKNTNHVGFYQCIDLRVGYSAGSDQAGQQWQKVHQRMRIDPSGTGCLREHALRIYAADEGRTRVESQQNLYRQRQGREFRA